MHGKHYTALLLFLLLIGCSDSSDEVVTGAHLVRHHDEYLFTPNAPRPQTRDTYPWEEKYVGGYPRITKEFFRCKGNPLNPVVINHRDGKEPLYYRDCQGGRCHSLPLRDGEEFVYPTLINLLNYIQEKTGKRVVVTSGHKCPAHNAYCDYTPYNWGSKHMIGAEVDFYVEGLENEPELIIALIEKYYPNAPFERYTKGKLNVATPPWMNKEIFVKLYLPDEGREFDNQHPYPYLSIQIRHDTETGARVRFSKETAQNYLR